MNPKDEFIMSTMEEIVPKDHLVRKLIKHVDFSFIRDLAKPYYSDIGRPGYDPVVLFKVAIIKSLFGISSMRKTCEEIKVNIAYRYFLGIPFSESTPDHSTYSRAYTTRFYQTDIYEQILKEVIQQIIDHDLLDTQYLFIDSTHIKASANKKKYIDKYVKKEKSVFEEELLAMVNEERDDHHQRPLPPTKPSHKTKRKKESKTDAESGWLSKGEKEHNFSYNSHAVCNEHGFILGQILKPSNIHDSQVFPEVFGLVKDSYQVEAIGLDAGYKTGSIIKRICDERIIPLMPYKRTNAKKGPFGNKGFEYDENEDTYVCPNGALLTYQKTTRQGYKEYVLDQETCSSCPFKKQCLSKKAKHKVLRVSVYKDYIDYADDIRKSDYGKAIYPLRKQSIERQFGDMKEKHGGRYTHYRGLKKVSDHVSLVYACMNMKKMAFRLDERSSLITPSTLLRRFIHNLLNQKQNKTPLLTSC